MAAAVDGSVVLFIPMGRGASAPFLCAPGEEVRQAKLMILDLARESTVRLEIGCNLGGTCLAYDYVAVDLDGWVHPCYMVRNPLFHVDDLERYARAKLESYQGRNAHECLAYLTG